MRAMNEVIVKYRRGSINSTREAREHFTDDDTGAALEDLRRFVIMAGGGRGHFWRGNRAEMQSGKMSMSLERMRSSVAGAEPSDPCRGPW